MQQLKLLFSLMGICLLLGLSSCSDEVKSVFGDDFDIPELTDANTIQFTVDATGEWKILEILASGGRMAIEWGDGRLQKIEKPDYTPIQYKYRTSKTFMVRVWAEELEFFSVSGILIPVSNMRVGKFPKMKNIDLNSVKATEELDLNASCPNLESMNIGNWEDLRELHIDECKNLEMINIYTHPKLASIKFGHSERLKTLHCADTGITSLSLKGLPALTSVALTGSAQLSALEVDANNGITTLQIEGCAFKDLDFLDKLTLLTALDCSSNKLTELDMSPNTKLWHLNCYANQLESLLIPKDNQLITVDCRYNKLDKDELNSVFNALVDISGYPSYYGTCVIAYGDNPGEEDCDKTILQDKHWEVK